MKFLDRTVEPHSPTLRYLSTHFFSIGHQAPYRYPVNARGHTPFATPSSALYCCRPGGYEFVSPSRGVESYSRLPGRASKEPGKYRGPVWYWWGHPSSASWSMQLRGYTIYSSTYTDIKIKPTVNHVQPHYIVQLYYGTWSRHQVKTTDTQATLWYWTSKTV